jgi:hypothetical protein
MKDLDQKRIRELFTYKEETGELRWLSRTASEFASTGAHRTWNKRFAGTIAGSVCMANGGYRKVKINGAFIGAHRIIWMYVNGEWPDTIDHINGVTDDNRLLNLRNVSNAENRFNLSRTKKNTSGIVGVSRSGSRWQASIGANGTQYHLGRFDTKEDAIAARKAAETRLGFHPNHGRAAA